METIPRKTLTEDEWNRKNHVWKNADPTTRGDGRDFNGIDNYQQYLDSLNGVAVNDVPDVNTKPYVTQRPILSQGFRNDGSQGWYMPQEIKEYFLKNGLRAPKLDDPIRESFRDWYLSTNPNNQQNWNPQEANAFGEYLQGFSNGAVGDSIPRVQNLILK